MTYGLFLQKDRRTTNWEITSRASSMTSLQENRITVHVQKYRGTVTIVKITHHVQSFGDLVKPKKNTVGFLNAELSHTIC